MSIKILYKDGDKRLILKYFIEKKIPINGSLINSEINKFFISAGENISWRDLTDELEENHIYIQSYYLLNQYYVQAKLDSKYTYYIPEKNDKFKNEQEDLNIKEKFEELMKEMQENK
ncbi:MAG TPA: hypothetical protein ENN73_00885 [Firmicutes bacterium]|nr:hypothetical protein [Bacillota bacterium]